MMSEQFEKLDRNQMRGTLGGLSYAPVHTAISLVNYDWLKIAAKKLRANLQVLPPTGPIPRG